MPTRSFARRAGLAALPALILAALPGCDATLPLDPVLPDGGIRDAALPLPADACPAALRAGQTYEREDPPPIAPVVPARPPEPAACDNGEDDDGDGAIDYPDDPGCLTAVDTLELDPPDPPACANGLDDDGDGRVDWPADPTCTGAGHPSERWSCPQGPVIELTGDAGELPPVPLGGDLPGEARYPGCAAPVGSAIVLHLELDAPRSLTIEVPRPRSAGADALAELRIALLTDCAEGATTLHCGHGPTLYAPHVPAGPVDVVVHGAGPRVRAGEAFPLASSRTIRWHLGPPAPDLPGCSDGVDNDADGFTDAADPGCRGPDDPFEHDSAPPPACFDGVDRDGDGHADYPRDPECSGAGDPIEAACADDRVPLVTLGDTLLLTDLPRVIPEDGLGGLPRAIDVASLPGRRLEPALVLPDGRISAPRANAYRGCTPDDPIDPDAARDPAADSIIRWHLQDPAEDPALYRLTIVDTAAPDPTSPPACANHRDDDGDGLVDLDDPGCVGSVDLYEDDSPGPSPACANGLDDDGDGRTDWPRDADCLAAGDTTEGTRDCSGGPAIGALDPRGGVLRRQSFVGDDARGRCQPPDLVSADFVMPLHLERPTRVDGRSFGLFEERGVVVHARARCDDPETEVTCGATPLVLPPGDWWLFVEDVEIVDVGSLTLTPLARCVDGVDNDDDGLTDAADPGCAHPGDDDELDPAEPPACANGLDDDGDGRVDHGDDPECLAPGGAHEDHCRGRPIVDYDPVLAETDPRALPRALLPNFEPTPYPYEIEQTALVVDVEAGHPLEATRPYSAANPTNNRVLFLDRCDGEVRYRPRFEWDYPDIEPGRYLVIIEWHAPDTFPFRPAGPSACADRIDNDGDGRIDLADPGCVDLTDTGEGDPPRLPACADGLDGDGDGRVDWPADPGCHARGDSAEGLACGLTPVAGTIAGRGGRLTLRPGSTARTFTGGCGLYAGQAAAQIVVERPSRVAVTTAHSTAPPVLALRCNCHLLGARGEIACDRAAFPRREASLEVDLLEPGVYALVVGGLPAASDATVVEVAIDPL